MHLKSIMYGKKEKKKEKCLRIWTLITELTKWDENKVKLKSLDENISTCNVTAPNIHNVDVIELGFNIYHNKTENWKA